MFKKITILPTVIFESSKGTKRSCYSPSESQFEPRKRAKLDEIYSAIKSERMYFYTEDTDDIKIPSDQKTRIQLYTFQNLRSAIDKYCWSGGAIYNYHDDKIAKNCKTVQEVKEVFDHLRRLTLTYVQIKFPAIKDASCPCCNKDVLDCHCPEVDEEELFPFHASKYQEKSDKLWKNWDGYLIDNAFYFKDLKSIVDFDVNFNVMYNWMLDDFLSY
jgi:hypothetical protein